MGSAKEKEAWRYYKTWMKEKTYSTALKSEVRITRKGWDHLNRGSRSSGRKVQDRYNKFNLLKIAKYIIKTSKTFDITFRDNEKYFIMKLRQKKIEIRVLIKEDSYGRKYFYSVMKH